MLEKLLTSKVRIKLLTIFLTNSKSRYYIRQLSRRLKQPTNAIAKELRNLEQIGLLICTSEGNLKFYQANTKHFLYQDLKNIIYKTVALGENLRGKFKGMDKVRLAFIYGSTAKGGERLDSDIDLLVIGNISDFELHKVLGPIEEEISREINYVLMSEKEFKDRKKKKDAFLQRILKGDKILLRGSEDEL